MENDKLKNGINELHEIRMTSLEKKQIFENIVPFSPAPVVTKSKWSFSYFNLLIERNHLVTYVIFFFLIFITGGGVVFDIISNRNSQTNNNGNIDIYRIGNDNTLNQGDVATDSTNNKDVDKNDVDTPTTPKMDSSAPKSPKMSNDATPPTSSSGEYSFGMATSTGMTTMVDNELGGTWVWQKTILNDGTIIIPNKAGEFTLSFKEDKRVNGETDCNNFSASYNIDSENNVNFGPITITEMYCEGSQEQIFTNFISDSNKYQINNSGELLFFLDDNSGYLLFKKY